MELALDGLIYQGNLNCNVKWLIEIKMLGCTIIKAIQSLLCHTDLLLLHTVIRKADLFQCGR